jgi:type II secretory pathway pseudopilin PulG
MTKTRVAETLGIFSSLLYRKQCAPRTRWQRAGLTLVELLVVVGIILMLMAVVIPRVQPNIEEARLREAARRLYVMLRSARVRAIESGRPVGVAFERLPEQPNACRVVHKIELRPLLYAGGSVDACLQLTLTPKDLLLRDKVPPLIAKVSVGAIADGLIRPGDRIRFGLQGPWYRLAQIPRNVPRPPIRYNPDSNDDGFIDFANEVDSDEDGFYDDVYLGMMLPEIEGATIEGATIEGAAVRSVPWPSYPNFGPPVSFVIERMPDLDADRFWGALLRSAEPPLRLPEQVVIDLGFSGLSPGGKEFAVKTPSAPPVLVIFSPAGAVEEVYCAGDGTDRNGGDGTDGNGGDRTDRKPFRRLSVTQPICFLIGRWDRMPLDPANPVSPADDGLFNWEDIRNLWVAIQPQTGVTTVAPVFADSSRPGGLAVPSDLKAARKLVLEAQLAMGGR